MPVARKKLARRGVANTSCRQPFPGHPGLSQSRSQLFVSDHCTATVLSRNMQRLSRKCRLGKAMFCTTFPLREMVNKMGVTSFTGYSHWAWDAANPLPRLVASRLRHRRHTMEEAQWFSN